MPYKTVPPVDEATMNKKRYLGHHTICQKLREIWEMTDSQEIKFKTREAMAMAKRMHEKLKSFKEYRESGEYHED